MLCDKCGKNNATVYVKQIINNKETVQHLCEQCAHEIMDIGNFSLDKFFNNSYFEDAFASPLGGSFGGLGESLLKCPVCGMTYNDFSHSGKLGCSECYTTFGDRILPVVKSIHGKNQHVGKVRDGQCTDCGSAVGQPASPEQEGKYYEKLALQKQLQELIKTEKFEEAAEVRDKIKAIDEVLNDVENSGGQA